MQLFQSVRRYFKAIGIIDSRQHPNSKWNWKYLLFFIALSQLVISSAGFLIFKAGAAAEYGYAFCQLLNGCAAIAVLTILIWKSENTFKLLEEFEKFIDKSE